MGFFDFLKPSNPTYESITAEALKNLIEEQGAGKLNVIDVRSEGEFNSGHIPKAININVFSSSFSKKIDRLDKERTYYIICASGNRSKTASRLMMKNGFANVYNVKMGMMGYRGPTQ